MQSSFKARKEIIINLMFSRHLGPVIDDSKLMGIVTLQDVSSTPRNSPAKELMKANVTTITPDKTSLEAFRIMNENNIGRLPVVNNAGELKGIAGQI